MEIAADNDKTCCTCCGAEMRVFFEQSSVPVNSCLLVDSPEKARSFPRGDIALAACEECGFIRNAAFDPRLTEYSGRYEETQAYSPTFNNFHAKLADDLVAKYDIRNKHIVEIGCGKGEFLSMICRAGSNTGVGFDPSYDEKRGILDDAPGVRVVRDFYSDAYGEASADVVVCKMTLEHIAETAAFVRSARLALKPSPDSLAFFQVPESMRILRNCAFEDIYYEHCSYFTPGSLARLFRRCRFDVSDLKTTYADQYLTVEARIGNGNAADKLTIEEDPTDVVKLVAGFAKQFEDRIGYWRDTIASRSRNGPVVIWGSGSKGVAFLHALGIPRVVRAAVDINPNRQGHYMLGTAEPIISPDDLRSIGPATVIAMNAVYRDEIAASLDELGSKADLMAL